MEHGELATPPAQQKSFAQRRMGDHHHHQPARRTLSSGEDAESGLPEHRMQETPTDQKIRPDGVKRETPTARNRSPAAGGALEEIGHE